MNQNLQPGTHPDADKLSVFVEGGATAREQKWMLAHLAECADCRKAVFLMQPQEEIERATAAPGKGWVWWRFVRIALPAAAIACGLVAFFIYIRPEGTARNPQQVASVGHSEVERPPTTMASTTKLEGVAQPEGPKSGFAPGTAETEVSRRKNLVPSDSDLTAPTKQDQATGNGAGAQMIAAAPYLPAPNSDAARSRLSSGTNTASALPLNGGIVANDGPLSKSADTKSPSSQNSLYMKKDLPTLQIERAGGKADSLAGVSGYITDRSGAVVAGATVTLRDASGNTRETTTGIDGSFRLTALPAGQYELTAAARGFKTSEQSIELKPSELAMLQPKLDVGAVSEQVTVEASASQQIQTESASLSAAVSSRAVAEMPITGRNVSMQSGLLAPATVSYGKRFLSLDSTGNLFLSRNGGKKWKKVDPQWVGTVVRAELTPAYSNEGLAKGKEKNSAPPSEGAVFQLTTDTGVVWNSKDGAHWHRQ